MKLQSEKRDIIRCVLEKPANEYFIDAFMKYFNQIEKIRDINYDLYEKTYTLAQNIDCENGKSANKVRFDKSNYWLYKIHLYYVNPIGGEPNSLTVSLAIVE